MTKRAGTVKTVIRVINYASAKLFYPHPIRGSPGVRGNICVIKKGGALENGVKRGRGTLELGV